LAPMDTTIAVQNPPHAGHAPKHPQHPPIAGRRTITRWIQAKTLSDESVWVRRTGAQAALIFEVADPVLIAG
jgi:hypothetical protein